jgi:hypothetical protein
MAEHLRAELALAALHMAIGNRDVTRLAHQARPVTTARATARRPSQQQFSFCRPCGV